MFVRPASELRPRLFEGGLRRKLAESCRGNCGIYIVPSKI